MKRELITFSCPPVNHYQETQRSNYNTLFPRDYIKLILSMYCPAVDSAVPRCCVQQAGGQGQPGCGGISFHLRTICQQDCSIPQGFVAAAKAGGEW